MFVHSFCCTRAALIEKELMIVKEAQKSIADDLTNKFVFLF